MSILLSCSAQAQELSKPGHLKILGVDGDDGYRAPVSPKYKLQAQKLKSWHVLEKLQASLSPVRFPREIGLLATECDGGDFASPFYNRINRTITLCYQFVAFAEKVSDSLKEASDKDPNAFLYPATKESFLGAFLAGVLLHETGHAVFDILDVPVLGREEDAADQFAIYIALQLRPGLAKEIVGAYAYFWKQQGAPDIEPTLRSMIQTYADEHGTAPQRFYNCLCLAYGFSQQEYSSFTSAGWLPLVRAGTCKQEYQQISFAFNTTVLPFLDEKRLALVKSVDWLTASMPTLPNQ